MKAWRGLIAAGGIAALFGALWLAFSKAAYTPEPVHVALPTAPVAPDPAPPPIPTPRPAGIKAPPPVADPPPAPAPQAVLDIEDHKTVQRAVHGAVVRAREACVRPWVEENQTSAELVVDAIFDDGAMVDLRTRGLTEGMDVVVECVRDTFWQTEFPEIDGVVGEIRYQRAIDVPWREPVEPREELDAEEIEVQREAYLDELGPEGGPLPPELFDEDEAP